jgi:TolB protein
VRGRLAALTLASLGLCACHLPVEPQERPKGVAPTAPPSPPDLATPAPKPPSPAEAPDTLRDPRERHLRLVRQITAGGRVAFPVFSSDGQSLTYLRARAGSVDLERYDLATKKPQTLAVGPGEPLALSRLPSGAFCLAVASATCKLTLLPEPWMALQCRTLDEVAIPAALGSCPQPKPRVPTLPCALGSKGERACPVLDAAGATLELYPRDEGLVRPLGQGRGVDFAPAFSTEGTLLVWLSTRPFRELDAESPLTRLLLLEIAALPTAPRGLGPDQVHNLDPTWFPGKQRVIFASTADDAGGRDYDLFAIEADGTGLVRLTFSPGTDRFPALSPDGTQIAWVSERNFSATGDEDLFLAEWVE